MGLSNTSVGIDFFSRRVRLKAASAAGVAAAALLAASPSSASFHDSHIERAMTGLDGTTDVQFVQIQMDSAGQNQVTGSKLIAFKADGTFDHVVLVVPDKVVSGAGASWLMASTAFEMETGMAPDFVFDSTDGLGLFPKDGMVCWGRPTTSSRETKPATTGTPPSRPATYARPSAGSSPAASRPTWTERVPRPEMHCSS